MNLNDYPLWTALITPLTPGLQVDYPSLKKLLIEQDEAGNGLLILGSTGEALNLCLDDRERIVNFVLEQKLKSPLMIGVGGHELNSQIKWIEWLETKNIDAYLMVTPIYAKPGDEGQYQWFKNLMDRVTKPVMLYNVPGRAAKELSYKAVSKLKDHPNFWSIKEASGCAKKMSAYLKACGHKKVYCGDDGLMPEFSSAGACGLISVASNVWPKATNLYTKKCLDKSFSDHNLWSTAANSLFTASNPIPAKAIICAEKRIAHDTLMPPLTQDDLQNKEYLMQQNNLINQWYQNNK
ncbi:MAG: 4-hydroxy-tetrahydrodipicolinate synthase [Halobacteriovoraceae bacterium]|jgi:4-hydroxy-tetrahydrodipicolinate synthase|nr:4-hydroxy-tetrahydrodipicolinate synthase [Halobacteriovoraceae bacterium]